jgi:hypothetical protein
LLSSNSPAPHKLSPIGMDIVVSRLARLPQLEVKKSVTH